MTNHQKQKRQFLGAIGALAATAAAWPLTAHAAYPDRPLRLVVPFPPGGPADNYARILGTALSSELGQPVVIDNRPGVSGAIGVQSVARSAPDGYTLGVTGYGAAVFLPLLTTKLLFDTYKDLSLLGGVVASPNLFVVSQAVKANSISEFIALAKEKPGSFTYASTGIGSTPHVLGALFQQASGTKLLHVPYKGAAPAMQELISGQVDVFIGEAPGVLPFVQSGKVKALFVAEKERMSWLPNLPKASEVGLADVVMNSEYGLVGPKGLPDGVRERVQVALRNAMKHPDLLSRFNQQYGIPAYTSSADFEAKLRSESARWLPVVRAANITLD